MDEPKPSMSNIWPNHVPKKKIFYPTIEWKSGDFNLSEIQGIWLPFIHEKKSIYLKVTFLYEMCMTWDRVNSKHKIPKTPWLKLLSSISLNEFHFLIQSYHWQGALERLMESLIGLIRIIYDNKLIKTVHNPPINSLVYLNKLVKEDCENKLFVTFFESPYLLWKIVFWNLTFKIIAENKLY